MRATLTLLVGALFLSACGQSGTRLSPSPVGDSAPPPQSSRLPAPPAVASSIAHAAPAGAQAVSAAPAVVFDGATRSLPSAGTAGDGAAVAAPAAPYLNEPIVFGTRVDLQWIWESYFGGDPPTSYVLFYTLPGGTSGSTEVTSQSVRATDLAVGTYSIKVAARNQGGQSAWSATRTFTIAGDFDPGATQAFLDMLTRRATDSRFGTTCTAVLGVDRGYFTDYDLRWMDCNFTMNRTVRLYHTTAKVNAAVRFTIFFDPDVNAWTPWVPAR